MKILKQDEIEDLKIALERLYSCAVEVDKILGFTVFKDMIIFNKNEK